MRGEGEPMTCMFSTFAQVLPAFPDDFQLSFPLVRALQPLARARGVSVSPPFLPASLAPFANQEAQGYAIATEQHGERGESPRSLKNSTVCLTL